MKRTITISFLLILFFGQIGYAVINMVQQHMIKEEMEAHLLATVSENELQVIDADLNKNDIKWEEAGKEFSLDGQLYDVAKIITKDGKNLIYCLNDSKEEQLLEKYAKSVESAIDQHSSKNSGDHIIKFQLADCLLFDEQTLSKIPETTTQQYFVFNDKAISSYREIKGPPPRTIFIQTKPINL